MERNLVTLVTMPAHKTRHTNVLQAATRDAIQMKAGARMDCATCAMQCVSSLVIEVHGSPINKYAMTDAKNKMNALMHVFLVVVAAAVAAV